MSPPRNFRRAVSIDDTRTSQAIVSHALNQVGFETKQADDGFKGWQLVESFEPDLVITDLDMPNWGGWQLIEAIRHTPNPRVESVPIIVCSATDDPLAIREAFDAGASYFLAKPIDMTELVSLLQWVIEEKSSRQEHSVEKVKSI
jgi:CheY-like chemotaxis protein